MDALRVGERGHIEKVHKGFFFVRKNIGVAYSDSHTPALNLHITYVFICPPFEIASITLFYSVFLDSHPCVLRCSIGRATNCSKRWDSTCNWQILFPWSCLLEAEAMVYSKKRFRNLVGEACLAQLYQHAQWATHPCTARTVMTTGVALLQCGWLIQ